MLLIDLKFKPADDTLAVQVLLNFLCLLLQTLLQAFIFALESKNFLVKLLIHLELPSELLCANLRHAIHVRLHCDKSLEVFLKGLLRLAQLLHFF